MFLIYFLKRQPSRDALEKILQNVWKTFQSNINDGSIVSKVAALKKQDSTMYVFLEVSQNFQGSYLLDHRRHFSKYLSTTGKR